MNFYNEKNEEEVSLLSYIKKTVLKQMKLHDEHMEKHDQAAKKTGSLICSSESEADSSQSQSQADKLKIFESVINDYLGETDQKGKIGSLHKSILEYSTRHHKNEMKQKALMYLKLEKAYMQKVDETKHEGKKTLYKARALLCHIASQILRSSNSSSIIERCFSDSLRSVSDKRVQLRNIFKLKILKICNLV